MKSSSAAFWEEMNLCVLKHSHKAQILEDDESLAEDPCFSNTLSLPKEDHVDAQ